jgi:flavodoxin
VKHIVDLLLGIGLPLLMSCQVVGDADLPESIDAYDIILLGHPNRWVSIPMSAAAFLESCDFSGKTILPFCSHGGGHFGQSLTAIAKLAPRAVVAPGLSVHYSGGSGLPGDVRSRLESQGIQTDP